MFLPGIPIEQQLLAALAIAIGMLVMIAIKVVLTILAIAVVFGVVWVVALPLRGLAWLIRRLLRRPKRPTHREVTLADILR